MKPEVRTETLEVVGGPALKRLREALAEVADLNAASLVLGWDQETYMPAGGVEDRAAQLSTLRRLAHERFTSAKLGELLDAAAGEVAGSPYDSDEASLVRVTRRDRELAIRLPAELVAERARAGARARPVWRTARAKSDWNLFAPNMKTTVDLARQVAEATGYEERPYDALLERTEPGLTTAKVETLFAELKAAIIPLLRAVAANGSKVDDSVLKRPCDPGAQARFSVEVIGRLGYDFERGRLDMSAHPFCTGIGQGDVRLTTRTGPTFQDSCVLASVHESGHGMYIQGLPGWLARSPLWGGASPGIHESQSRLWENMVARSQPFWDFFFEPFRDAFPGSLDDIDASGLFRALNRVQPSYIRVDADELTYNLHILLRFEIENDLLEERLQVSDVPEAWNSKLREYLGLEPPPASQGPLQDIHWCFPSLGGFVGYALGNLASAQLMEAMRAEISDLDASIARGDFALLLGWLRERVHVHGRKFTPDELLQRATGRSLTPEPWIRYVQAKFGQLYGLA